MENTTTSFYKMKDLKSSSAMFDFKCPHCKSDNITLIPTGVCYRPLDNLDNSDIEDKKIRNKLDQLPFIQKAILQCLDDIDKRIMSNCTDCTKIIIIENKLDKLKLQKKMVQLYGSEPMLLNNGRI